jgi:biopolymer transport protein ExbD
MDAELPAQVQSPHYIPPATQIVAEYGADRVLRINQRPVALEAAAARFAEIYASRRDKTLYVMGDGSLEYGEVMTVIDLATGAGADRIGIITAGMRESGTPRPR